MKGIRLECFQFNSVVVDLGRSGRSGVVLLSVIAGSSGVILLSVIGGSSGVGRRTGGRGGGPCRQLRTCCGALIKVKQSSPFFFFAAGGISSSDSIS
jgi:hypothetical protein